MTTSTPRYPDPHELHTGSVTVVDLPVGQESAGPRRPRSGSWVAAAMLAVLLAVGVVVDSATAENNPHPGAAVSFAVGEDVTLPNFRVHVNGARVAETILDGEQQLETAGVWLLVDLSYANVRRPDLLNDLGVRDHQGRTYSVTDRHSRGTWVAAPDTWFRGEVVFEVPASALAEGEVELLVWPSGRSQAETVPMRYGSTRLPVDPAAVATEPVEVAAVELLPAGQR